jgi:hypothetical protein
LIKPKDIRVPDGPVVKARTTDFLMIQDAVEKNSTTLTEAQRIIVPELVKHLEAIIASLGNKVQ